MMRFRRSLHLRILAAASLGLALTLHAQQPAAKVLDVLRVSAEGDASTALVTPRPGPIHDVRCDIVIAGGGFGGVSAALAATKDPKLTVCMTEPTLWVGGQATSQGVSAFDDNKYIDTTGGTASYLDLSRRIRLHYAAARRDRSLTAEQAIAGPIQNPGGCWVGRLCFEPAPAHDILMSLLQPALTSGRLKLFTHTALVSVDRDGRTLRSVLAYDFTHSEWLRLRGRYFVEATERGELLALSGLPFRIGAEAQSETHERNAPAVAQPRASQSYTYTFLLQHSDAAPSTGDPQPPDYATYLPHYTLTVDYGHGKLLTYGFYQARPGLPGSFWVYRRSVDAALFQKSAYPYDRAMINWSSNDHCDANLLSGTPLQQAQALQNAKRDSLGFAWWMRHTVPRDDGSGKGYPDLHVLPDAMGSSDGLSQFPYIRESRRIVPIRTIVEEDLAVDFQPGARAALYPDTVGIGWYPIDIHSCDRQDFTSASKPYEVPLSALIARDADNLLAVGKSIGVTHITNGAYRLHPTEWAEGEAVGAALSFSITHHIPPAVLDRSPAQLRRLQTQLVLSGHPIFWYDDVPVGSPGFAALQMAGVAQWWPDNSTLHAAPAALVTSSQAASALHRPALAAKSSLTWVDLGAGQRTGPVTRAAFAAWRLHR
jgi:hypothetical protein